MCGGYLNEASGIRASVEGGYGNSAAGAYANVSGGLNRFAPGTYDWADCVVEAAANHGGMLSERFIREAAAHPGLEGGGFIVTAS